MDYLTVADFQIVYSLEILTDIETHLNENKTIDKFSNLKQLVERVHNLDAIKKYKTEDKRAKRFHFNHFIAKMKI